MTDLPSAADALRAAYDIVRTPCSAAETQRATLLFEIARELRVAADMRALNARREAADKLRLDLEISRARGKLAAAGIPWVTPPVPAFAAEAARAADRYAAMMRNAGYAGGPAQFSTPDSAVTQLREQEPAQEWSDPVTQVLQVPPAHGDKADCRYCHTPIVFEARRMQDPVTLDDGDPQYLWVHKYTDQRVCAVAVMGGQEAADATHTFAEPEPRG